MSSDGFTNAVVGGQGALVRELIKSPNFQADVQGWQIAKDGSAEFDNLTIRGQFFGTDFIINSNGLFVYTGVPALGNLFASIAATGGVDAFGNAYGTGLCFYDASENLLVNINANGITIQNGNADGQFNQGRQGLSLTFFQQITHLGSLILTYLDSLGGSHTYASLGSGGFNILAGLVTAVHPGTGTLGTPAVAETWQTPTGLGSNWVLGDTSGTLRSLQFRKQADGSCWLYGAIHCTTAPPGATMFTLSSGYFDPNSAQRINLSTQQGTTFAENFCTIDASGNVAMVTNPTVNNTNLYFDNMIRTS